MNSMSVQYILKLTFYLQHLHTLYRSIKMLSNITSSGNLIEYSLGEGIGQNTENLKISKNIALNQPNQWNGYFIESVIVHPQKSSQAQNHKTPTSNRELIIQDSKKRIRLGRIVWLPIPSLFYQPNHSMETETSVHIWSLRFYFGETSAITECKSRQGNGHELHAHQLYRPTTVWKD